MSPNLNRQAQEIPLSGIRKIAKLAAEVSKRGQEVYPFHLGRPNFDTPQLIKDSAIKRLEEGHVHYTPNAGILPLQEAIADSIKKHRNVEVDPGMVISTVGASEAVAISLMAVLEPESEVIVPTPCFPTYLNLPRTLGAKVVQVPLSIENGYIPTAEIIEPFVNEKTRAILINSPHNPTGAVIPARVMGDLVRLALEKDIWLISDEVYEHIVYDDHEHTSVLQLARQEDPVIYVSGLSKTYSMTGWRLGYVVPPPELCSVILKLHQYIVTSACSFVQWGAVTALNEHPGTADMVDMYKERRQSVTDGLDALGIEYQMPGGSFFVFPTIPESLPNDEEFCRNLLEHYGIAIVPGTCFGDDFRRSFRISYACSTAEVAKGMQVFTSAINDLDI